VCQRFGTSEQFLTKVTPDTQQAFAKNVERAVTGDYPTLTDIGIAYGDRFPAQWLTAQIADATLFVGAKNLDKWQQSKLAQLIATEYHYFKVTELLVFFHRFKTGRYGHFYGAVDPHIVMCSLREFVQERNDVIAGVEQRQREQREAEERKHAISYEEYLKLKAENQNNAI
jgi:hypothetical protein